MNPNALKRAKELAREIGKLAAEVDMEHMQLLAMALGITKKMVRNHRRDYLATRRDGA